LASQGRKDRKATESLVLVAVTVARLASLTLWEISSRRGFIPAVPPDWLPLARSEEITAAPLLPLDSERCRVPGSARVLLVVLVGGRAVK
jgi:hypothetical protein